MIKLFEMFSGYGGASFALKKAGIPFECVGYSEIDKYAIQCYRQNHCAFFEPEDIKHYFPKNFGDCTKINPEELPDFDLLTGGFPCQSFSATGKGKGELDSRGTLFFDIVRIAEVKKPKFMLLENVKGLTFKTHKATFNKILSELKRIGYNVNWRIMNTKEHGVPQNRERVFFACFRKDLDKPFYFPEKEVLKIFLKDILEEEEVDSKYYLKPEQVEKLMKGFYRSGSGPEFNKAKIIGNVNPSGKGMNGNVYGGRVSPTITTNKGEGPKVCVPEFNEPVQLDVSQIRREGKPRIYEKISKTLNTAQGRGHTPLIISSTQKHNSVKADGVSNCLPGAMGEGGGHTPMIMDVYNHKIKEDGICITLTEPHHNNLRIIQNCVTEASGRSGGSSEFKDSVNKVYQSSMQIRKLTPTECFRLMGFLNDEINLEGLSDTQKYKLAGNGWDINLVSKIFKQMFKEVLE